MATTGKAYGNFRADVGSADDIGAFEWRSSASASARGLTGSITEDEWPIYAAENG